MPFPCKLPLKSLISEAKRRLRTTPTVGLRSILAASGVMLLLVAVVTGLCYIDESNRRVQSMKGLLSVATSNLP